MLPDRKAPQKRDREGKMQEMEIKFKISKVKFETLKEELKKDNSPETICFERNVLLDTENNDLLKRGEFLRIRRTDVMGMGSEFIITHKKRVKGASLFKIAEEFNFEIDSLVLKDVLALLNKLGFKTKFLYEKKREDFRLNNALISFCVLPTLGYYLEIEGGEADIVKVCKLLGLSIKDGSNDNFMSLYLKYSRDRKLTPKSIWRFNNSK